MVAASRRRSGILPARSGKRDLQLRIQNRLQLALHRYRAITSAYYRGSLGALLVFSITDRESFKNVPRWLKELRDHTGPELVVILVGTKADLTAGRVVTRDEALALKFPYFEVSAKSGDNVTEAVTRLVKDVHAIHHSRSGTGTSPGGKVRVSKQHRPCRQRHHVLNIPVGAYTGSPCRERFPLPLLLTYGQTRIRFPLKDTISAPARILVFYTEQQKFSHVQVLADQWAISV